MSFSLDELAFLRQLYGLDPSDSSKDSVLTRRSVLNGAGFVPSDPGFYTDLGALAKALGLDPADLLVVMASESNFATGTASAGPIVPQSGPFAGHDISPRGLIGFTYVAVPSLMSLQEWDKLPQMSAKDQLVYVARAWKAAMARIGRPFANAFELYIANANPASLVSNPPYDLSAPMYSGAAWTTNFSLDRGPSGNAESYATTHGELSAYASNPLAYAKSLVSKGMLKGYVSLGDLQAHLGRMTQKGWNLAWKLAQKRYEDLQAEVQPTAYNPNSSEYEPDFGNPGEGSLSASSWDVARGVQSPIGKTESGALAFSPSSPVIFGVSLLGVGIGAALLLRARL